MTTCGLTYAGAPCEDQGEPLGLHGRASYTAATQVETGAQWVGDRYGVWVAGKIREYIAHRQEREEQMPQDECAFQ